MVEDDLPALAIERNPFFQAIPALIFVTVAGRNILVNHCFAAFTGKTEAELLGKAYLDVIHPDDMPQILALQEGAIPGDDEVSFTLRVRHNSGVYKSMLYRSAPSDAPIGGQRAVVGMMTEIESLPNDVASPMQSEIRLMFAQKAGGIGLWEWDVETDRSWWSPMMYELLGLPQGSGEETGGHFFDYVHAEDRAWLIPHMRAIVEQKTAYDREFRIIRADGAMRWMAGRGDCLIDDAGRVIRMLGVNFDVTSRKAIEQQLLDLNTNLEARVIEEADERDKLWALSEDMILQVQFDGTITRTNSATRKLIGARVTVLDDTLAPETRLRVQQALRMARETRMPFQLEIPLLTPDRSIRRISWSIAPDPENQRIFAVGRDLTAILQTQKLLREAEERLTQLQQIETLGQLASGVAHDFNNLLVPILGVLDMLKRRPQGDPDVDKLIDGASHAALSARSMVRRMLTFAQQRQGKAERVDVAHLITKIGDLITHLLPEDVALSIACEPGIPMVIVDPNQLESAIVNLAVNARDAMPHGGTLTILARHAPPCVLIEIVDSGTGMTAETLERATQAFYTTKPDGKGTGLGLFMAARLADRSSGKLAIESAPGEGTTVRLSLPAAS